MSKYILRLDDAAQKRNLKNWQRLEAILDKYGIKPLVGVIPQNEDPAFAGYDEDKDFWDIVKLWDSKGWTIAMHGFNHVYLTGCGGINPVNTRSEFAGLSLEEQKIKIADGVRIMKEHGLEPKVFFPPAHTFDGNTLRALQEESHIRVISDTIANDIYYDNGFYFVPQQSGRIRNLKFAVVTFCYHPNEMEDMDFLVLEKFISRYGNRFVAFSELSLKERKLNFYDRLLRNIYFLKKSR